MEKLCVDIIGTYVIRRKGQKENLNLKPVTTIDPVTGWFKITQYNNKILLPIVNFDETMLLTRYPRPMEITYDQVSEFISHKLSKSLIEK